MNGAVAQENLTKIGDVAGATRTAVETIRYYEREKLLPRATPNARER